MSNIVHKVVQSLMIVRPYSWGILVEGNGHCSLLTSMTEQFSASF